MKRENSHHNFPEPKVISQNYSVYNDTNLKKAENPEIREAGRSYDVLCLSNLF